MHLVVVGSKNVLFLLTLALVSSTIQHPTLSSTMYWLGAKMFFFLLALALVSCSRLHLCPASHSIQHHPTPATIQHNPLSGDREQKCSHSACAHASVQAGTGARWVLDHWALPTLVWDGCWTIQHSRSTPCVQHHEPPSWNLHDIIFYLFDHDSMSNLS